MPDLLVEYLAADHIGTALVALVVAAIFAAVKHAERLRPGQDDSDG